MLENNIKQWLKSQQGTIEKIILDAAVRYYENHKALPNFRFDLATSQEESYNLVNGEDLCYDRFTLPLSYSLWYQARRINLFISNFYTKIVEATNSTFPVHIFDLGAGTGAVQISLGLVYVCLARMGKRPTLFRISNVDTSPFMLNYLRSYLWPLFVKNFPELKEIAIDYNVYSWSNNADLDIHNPWICASYLFDSSDNSDYLRTNFEQIVSAFNPEKILLLSSAQAQKVLMMNSILSELRQSGYTSISTNSNEEIYSGSLNTVNSFRLDLIQKYNLKAAKIPVTWSDKKFTIIGVEKKQSGVSFSGKSGQSSMGLFNPPLRIRRDVVLSEDQKKASLFDNRPSIIIGPAGCGKSVVLTQKVIEIFEYYKWSKSITILITTFNKGLLSQLRNWMTDLLTQKKKSLIQKYYSGSTYDYDSTGEIVIQGQYESKIKFIHFEMLPKFVGAISYSFYNEQLHRTAIKQIIDETKRENSISTGEYDVVLNVDFILEEYHRVIYGLNCRISFGEAYYQSIERTGRGTKIQLQKNSNRRKLVWIVLKKYALWMHNNPSSGYSFIARRQLLLNKISDNSIKEKYDYVIVDEFQDCTLADYKIMTGLLKDVNNLIIAGDLAQAVHVGKSGTIPRDGDMSRRIFHRLNGSYRLPYRISEAIQPLSKLIKRTSSDIDSTIEMSPYKGSPPGARPIVVYAKNSKEAADKIISIKNQYGLFDLKNITILEKDPDLYNAIRAVDNSVETTTILRLKGLEKEFIVWSTQVDFLYESEYLEFAYTIMTRTNCILVILLTENTKQYLFPVLQYLNHKRLIFWDEESLYCLNKVKELTP